MPTVIVADHSSRPWVATAVVAVAAPLSWAEALETGASKATKTGGRASGGADA